MGGLALLLSRAGLRKISRWEKRVALGALAALSALVACWAWAFFVEADWIEVTRVTVESPRLPVGYEFRIVQVSDLHVEAGETRALSNLPGIVNGLDPDLFVFTGDAINSLEGLATFRDVLSRIHARLGRVAVRGNYDSAYFPQADLFGEGIADELTLEPKEIDEGRLTLCGAAYGNGGMNLARCLGEHPAGFRIVVFHTSDWVESLASLGPDLYLAGHTHGGQVRVPFYGALVTQYARFGKKYEMGRYQVGDTTLYVNRGIGFEPSPSPRIRFRCRPEVSVIDLVGTGP